MSCDRNPGDKVSYESYRKIVNTRFSISFGYARTDTCSGCDSLRAQLGQIHSKIESIKAETSLYKQQAKLLAEKQLHQRKAENFYSRKKATKTEAKTTDSVLDLAFDFHRKIPYPTK
ncbi:hypothetical protein PoB_004934100 [Plakobranchus ocellatus]|uniref:Uncharacterized protein n=1 Tax=Plakobranchus ocellatus TaxID=259542 RepID=A0AAV4BQT8_9GAST|nr:hypothetical protein PoB_004934100 [Plakobranchus ocellatus]